MSIYLRTPASLIRKLVRSLATVAPPSVPTRSSTLSTPVASPPATAEHAGPLRPHLQIPVNPNHSLYAFFRVKTDTNSHSKPREDGQPEYVALEQPTSINSGRSWNAAELRRKSFKDLHTLWYVLLRERNLLATQAEERRKVLYHNDPVSSQKARDCRKSMARIKAVLTERRNAYQAAIRLRRLLKRKPELQASQEPAASVESGSGNEIRSPSGEGMFESNAEQPVITTEKTP